MLVIGLTGGIASGKSTVSSLLRNMGACVIDADEVARDIVEPGQAAHREIVDAFGEDILGTDRGLDRERLAELVFSRKEALETLNRITHPRIIERIRNRIEEARRKCTRVVVVDAALLIEAGMVPMVDTVWVVTSPRTEQVARMVARGLEPGAAERRLKAQMETLERLRFADRVIENRGTLRELSIQVKKLWDEITDRGDHGAKKG